VVKSSKVMKMGKYDDITNLKEEQFRRLTGVKPQTFEKMVEILRAAQEKRRPRAVGQIS
jgi:hypothetical protein